MKYTENITSLSRFHSELKVHFCNNASFNNVVPIFICEWSLYGISSILVNYNKTSKRKKLKAIRAVELYSVVVWIVVLLAIVRTSGIISSAKTFLVL